MNDGPVPFSSLWVLVLTHCESRHTKWTRAIMTSITCVSLPELRCVIQTCSSCPVDPGSVTRVSHLYLGSFLLGASGSVRARVYILPGSQLAHSIQVGRFCTCGSTQVRTFTPGASVQQLAGANRTQLTVSRVLLALRAGRRRSSCRCCCCRPAADFMDHY